MKEENIIQTRRSCDEERDNFILRRNLSSLHFSTPVDIIIWGRQKSPSVADTWQIPRAVGRVVDDDDDDDRVMVQLKVQPI